MSNDQVVQMLVKEAEANPASSAVFHVFALRKRARNSINLLSLTNKMKKEGFTNYDKTDYVSVIRLLATLGLGELDTDAKGRVRGIKKIRVTLQSIGAAACKQSAAMEGFSVRNKFYKIPSKVEEPKPVEMKEKPSKIGLNLEFNVNGRILRIPVPKDIIGQDLAELVNKLHTA